MLLAWVALVQLFYNKAVLIFSVAA